MKRLVQKINYVVSYSYDGEGFNDLNGKKEFNSDNKPYISFEFAVTDITNVYFVNNGDDFTGMNDNENNLLNYILNVRIYKDEIKISFPYVPTDEWAKMTSNKIIDKLYDKYDSFVCDMSSYSINDDYYIGCPHPHITSYDIIEIFNDSLYNFHLIDCTKEELNERGIMLEEGTKLHVLKDALENEIGIYYAQEYDSFYFETDDLINKFDRMIYELLVNHSPSEYIKTSDSKLPDSGVLVLWLYWHGYPAVKFWDYMRDYIYLTDDKEYNRKECFNYIRSHYPQIPTLQLRRMEADLMELLSYEYPIRDINRNYMIDYFDSQFNKDITGMLWDKGIKYNINSFVNEYIPASSFNYEQQIGYKGDIIYYKSTDLPIKIALQLKRYKPVAPLKNNTISFNDAINVVPFGWYGKIIGIKKLDEDITESEIRSKLNIDELYVLYNSVFDEASQLRLKELDDGLDIIFNQPDTTAWD